MKKLLISALLVVSAISALAASEGVGFGYKDEIKVSVEKDGNKIVSIKVLEMKETKRIAEPAIAKLTSEIIAKQTVEVDDVAGATYTSQGFKEAVADALKK